MYGIKNYLYSVRQKSLSSIKDFSINLESYRLLRSVPGYLEIRVHISVCIIYSLEIKFCRGEVQRLKVKKMKKKKDSSIIYLCRFAIQCFSENQIKFSLTRHNSKRTPTLLEVRSPTFVLDVRYATFATPRIMASPIIDSIAECRSGVYDRRELSFHLSRFNVRSRI